jgi:hypothetical protein
MFQKCFKKIGFWLKNRVVSSKKNAPGAAFVTFLLNIVIATLTLIFLFTFARNISAYRMCFYILINGEKICENP